MAYQRLKDVAAKFVDVEFEYLGHCQRDEKFTQSVMRRKILVDLDTAAKAIPSLELLAKRLKYGPVGMTETLRFREEPVRITAPRKTTMFWRTLLGEVNV
jgi:hypothetical protein